VGLAIVASRGSGLALLWLRRVAHDKLICSLVGGLFLGRWSWHGFFVRGGSQCFLLTSIINIFQKYLLLIHRKLKIMRLGPLRCIKKESISQPPTPLNSWAELKIQL